MSQIAVGGLDEAADVGAHDQVGRAVAPFLRQALHQTVFGKDGPDLDAGLLGEGCEERIDQGGLAIGIDIDRLCRLGRKRQRREAGESSGREKHAAGQGHDGTLQVRLYGLQPLCGSHNRTSRETD